MEDISVYLPSRQGIQAILSLKEHIYANYS